MYSLGISLGMDPYMAKAALSDFPAMLIMKADKRRDPDVILSGLEVLSWGSPEGCRDKKMFGWY